MMRVLLGTALACAVGVSAGRADAALVQQSLTVVISGSFTTDTYGLLGQAGADLSGQEVTLYFQYNTANFKSAGSCGGADCEYYQSSGGPNISGAALIAASTANGRFGYAPFTSSQVVFDNNSGTHNFFLEADGGVQYSASASVSLFYNADIAFGSPLAPANKPIEGPDNPGDEMILGPPNSSTETLTFYVKKAVK